MEARMSEPIAGSSATAVKGYGPLSIIAPIIQKWLTTL